MEQEQNQINVPQEIIDKVVRFSDNHETFTTKQLFEAYPNNPEHLLRSALVILRNNKKVFMYGNKRGAYYSKNNNIDTNAVSENNENKKATIMTSLKEVIMEKANKLNGNWFKRPDLVIEEASIPSVIESLKELISDGKIITRGAKRWTEYKVSDGSNSTETQKDNNDKQNITTNDDIKETILNFIKQKRIVTIPMIVEKLEIQRYVVVKVLDELIEKEEIWHEGIKKSSKYIYKTVNVTEIDGIVADLQEERSIVTSIDDLSTFLHSDDNTVITIGYNTKLKPVINFVSHGERIKEKEFETIEDLLKAVYDLTELKNG